MEPGKVVREQLLQLLRGGNAHMVFDQAVERFPLEKINARPPGSDYTPWRLLEHMRIAQWDILEFVRNPNHVSPPWPEGYWPPEGQAADESRWKETIQKFHEDLQAMQAIVENPGTNLFDSLPHAPGYTVLREVLVLADHNAYHMGEFGLLRQMIGAWPG
jgi:DinB family protein